KDVVAESPHSWCSANGLTLRPNANVSRTLFQKCRPTIAVAPSQRWCRVTLLRGRCGFRGARLVFQPITLCVLVLSVCGVLTAGTFSVFRADFVRTTARPNTFTRTFQVLGPTTKFTLRVTNGGSGNQFRQVSNGTISVNGVEIV